MLIVINGGKMTAQNRASRGIALFLVVMLAGFFCLSALAPETDTGKGNAENSSGVTSSPSDEDAPAVQEHEAPPKVAKKHFPWFWVAAGTVVVGAILYFSVIKKPEYSLSVSKGKGIGGTPVVGTFVYKKGKKVHYLFWLDYGYRNLKVMLDNAETAASGEIEMDRDHVLTVTSEEQFYDLTVTTNEGVTGTPATGTYSCKAGTSVNYNYVLANGYIGLQVKLDGVQVATQGTIVMDRAHTLASAAQSIQPPGFDVRGTWRLWRMPGPDAYDPLEMVVAGSPYAGEVYYSINSWHNIGKYTVSDNHIEFEFYPDGLHFTEFTGTIQDGNNMNGTYLRHHCDLCGDITGAWRAIRIQ
jgi:hypothetical protein